MSILKKIILWLYIKVHSIFINISIALYNTETELLKADPNITNEKDKKNQRKRHRNEILEKFYAGKRDEKFVKDYYELLEKADDFKRKSTPFKQAVAADKHAKSYGQKDRYGRRYEHFGFFDDNHKHAGKTIGEVIDIEMKERRTKDDEYELIQIYNNEPIECGVSKYIGNGSIDKTQKKSKKVIFNQNVVVGDDVLYDINNVSSVLEYPIKIHREIDVINKIEQLTDFLHVKKTAFDYRLLEFFIPLKFKTNTLSDNDKIMKELISIKEIYVKDDYGNLIGYGVSDFVKRIIYNDQYEVFKFNGIEFKTIK